MKYIKNILMSIVILLLLLALRYTYKIDSSKELLIRTTANNTAAVIPDKTLQEDTASEKRGTPTYDYIIGKDGWPHYRVFFWVPKNADNLVPYADKGINTDVSEHGPVEKWSVVVTDKVNENEKLVFIYVPKTFIFFYGTGFEKVIHLKYKSAFSAHILRRSIPRYCRSQNVHDPLGSS
jgi:hypothetical protein